MIKVLFIHTHPVQYQVPLYRLMDAEPDIEVEVCYFSDHSVVGGIDRGFGSSVQWDIPLLNGYRPTFLKNEGCGNIKPGFWSYRYFHFPKLIKDKNPDVIILQGHYPALYIQAYLTAHVKKIPLVARYESFNGSNPSRGKYKEYIRKKILKTYYKKFDRFGYTGYFANIEADDFGIPPNKRVFMPHCIDTELISRNFNKMYKLRNEIRNEIGMNENDLGVVFMAKFLDWKNPSLIIHAVNKMENTLRKRVFPILAGSGPEYDTVVKLANKVCGPGRYYCPGFVNQSEICRYYAAGDVFVLPSKRGRESWGLVVNEAMTCGLPVAVTDGVGCRKDLVEGKGTGWVFADGDADHLSKILSEWLENEELRLQQGTNASNLIQQYSSFQAANGLLQAVRGLYRLKNEVT